MSRLHGVHNPPSLLYMTYARCHSTRMIPPCQGTRIRANSFRRVRDKRRRRCGPPPKRSRAAAGVEDVAGVSLVTEFSLYPHPLVPFWFIYRSKCVLLRFSVQVFRWRPSSLPLPQVWPRLITMMPWSANSKISNCSRSRGGVREGP